jgi:hypothetical protein
VTARDRIARPLAAEEPPSFDELVTLLRERLGYADAISPSELHSFKELMKDRADVIPDNWYQEAFDELEAQGHLDPTSSKVFGDAAARLSADGRLFLRESSD